MPQQLIYTSAPRGLVAGRSGYCTVARSATMREALMLRLEQFSYYQHLSLSGGREHPIFAYRILDLRGSRFHVLSRIQDAGLDYTGRTNFIAHHLVITPEEIPQLPTPAVILGRWPGWLTSWKREPESLQHEDWEDLTALAKVICLPARTWAAVARDAANGYGLLEAKAGTTFRVDASSENRVLDLLAESSELLETRDNRRNFRAAAWQYTFTTSLQEQDNVADFRWRLVDASNPAFAKLSGPNCLPLASVRASACTEDELTLARTGWKAPGSVVIQAKQHSIAEGSTARFEARADGIPLPAFQWYEIENGQPVRLEGQTRAVLEVSPRGRAKRYMARAVNSAGYRDSRIVELSIQSRAAYSRPYRPAPDEYVEVRPSAKAPAPQHSRSGDAIEQQRARLMAEQAERAWRRKQNLKRGLIVSLSTIAIIAAVWFLMRPAPQGAGQTTPGTNSPANASAETNPPAALVPTNAPADNPPSSPTNLASATVPVTNTAAKSDEPKGLTKPAIQPKLPDPYTNLTVGSFAASTQVEYTNETYIIRGTGGPFTGTNDSFVFVCRKVSGDGEFTVRFNGVPTNTPGDYRCGIMMRESEKTGAPFVFAGITMQYAPSNGLWAFRAAAEGEGKETAKAGTPKKGFKLKREGNTFCGYADYGSTGRWQWPALGTNIISMKTKDYLVGLVVCSRDTEFFASFAKPEWQAKPGAGRAGAADQ